MADLTIVDSKPLAPEEAPLTVVSSELDKPTLGSKVGAFLSGAKDSVVNAVKSTAQWASNPNWKPTDAVKDIGPAFDQTYQRAKDAEAKGDWAGGAIHRVLSLIPGVGPAISENYADMRDAQNRGDEVAEANAAGKMIGIAGTAEAGRVLPGAAETAADAIGSAATALPKAAANAAQSGLLRDIAGVASPRLSHLLSLADRAKKAFSAAQAPEAPPIPRDVVTGQALQSLPNGEFTEPGTVVTPPKQAAAQRVAMGQADNDPQIAAPPQVPQAPPMAGAQPQAMPQPAAPQPVAQPQPKPVVRVPAVAAGTPQLQTPSTPTAPEGPITWEASKDPDIARKLDAGATRLMPDGSTEVLREVPFRDENGVQQIHQDVDPDTGQANQVYEPTVQRYMKDGWAVQPQLRLSTDAEKPGFIVNDGHHRIEAADRLGRNSILAWTPEEAPASPEDAAAERIKNVIQMPSPAQANPMEGLSPEMQKAAADANYRGIKEGAEGAEPVALYKGAAQANKATKLAQQLYDSQIGHADLSQLSPAKLRQHLGDMTKAMGINKTGQISDDSVGNVLFELKKLEAKNKPKLVK